MQEAPLNAISLQNGALIATFALSFQKKVLKSRSQRIRSRKKPGILTSACAIILMLMYVAGTVEVDSIHSLIHSEGIAGLHSAKNEADPCHQTIYHNLKGCHHKSHVIQADKCPMCQISLHNNQFGAKRLAFEGITSSVVIPQHFTGSFISEIVTESSSRAPPFIL